MRPHGASVVITIVERNAILFRHQGVDCERVAPGPGETWQPVSLHFGSAGDVAALAAFDGSSVIVEVKQRFQAALLAGVNPINDDTDSIERFFCIRHTWSSERLLAASRMQLGLPLVISESNDAYRARLLRFDYLLFLLLFFPESGPAFRLHQL